MQRKRLSPLPFPLAGPAHSSDIQLSFQPACWQGTGTSPRTSWGSAASGCVGVEFPLSFNTWELESAGNCAHGYSDDFGLKMQYLVYRCVHRLALDAPTSRTHHLQEFLGSPCLPGLTQAKLGRFLPGQESGPDLPCAGLRLTQP